MRRFPILILILTLIQLTALKGFGYETQNSLPGSSEGGLLNAILFIPNDIASIKKHLGSISLQTVKDGKIRTTAFSREDLLPVSELPLDGYVTGLVIRGSRQMEVYIDGKKMDEIRSNKDGTVSIKNFGNSSYASLGISESLNRYHSTEGKKQPLDRKEGRFVSGLYSFFPGIVAEAISSASKVDIDLTVDGRTVRMSLLNPGYVDLSVDQRDPIGFRYLGSRLQKLKNRPTDLQDRIDAITEGILAVERMLGAKLVNNVNIIDYEPIHDAVTVKRKHDIWFYISSFSKESLEELKSMAKHETIHIYVDSKNLTVNSGIRHLFADLKGYGEWSMERFALVATGRIRRRSTAEKIDEDPFFAFIDERNFQEGRLGGHSHSNVDEFCTSFIHSLMFIERLPQNLENPVKFPGRSQQAQHLTKAQKEKILATYIYVLELISKYVGNENRQEETVKSAQSLFQQALAKLKNLS